MSDPEWNSIAFFYNFPDDIRPPGYVRTTSRAALNFLDEGTDPVTPPVSEFIHNYWKTLTYGSLSLGLETPKDAWGNPLVPTLRPASGNAYDFAEIITAYLERHAEAVWEAAGAKTQAGVRWIPSIMLVPNYDTGGRAGFRGSRQTINGREYLIGDTARVRYSLSKVSAREIPEQPIQGRRVWGVLAHEYAHNFGEYSDLYEPQGAMGYWGLLGASPRPGRMSEISSLVKERIGWIRFKNVINGPQQPVENYSLRPYTTYGDAIKIIPDPDHNPHEYFLLEYRKSTGTELWRPDGGLTEEGLLITHVNTRLGNSPVFLMREAPHVDPEFADFRDLGTAERVGDWDTDGVLFPQGANNSFTRTSQPSSNFYGGRASGLSIENIRISGGRCRFSIGIDVRSHVGWHTSSRDTAVAGRFHGQELPHTIFMRNDSRAQMLRMIQSQWFSVQSANGWMGDWQLTASDKPPLVGDFSGDGRDELYMRDANRAGIVGFNGSWFSRSVQTGWIGNWNLGSRDWEVVADVDGDGRDEVVIRSPQWMGLLKLEGSGTRQRLELKSILEGNVGDWQLGPRDRLLAGHFRDAEQQDVVMVAPDDLGLMSWNSRSRRFTLRRRQHDAIYGWNLDARDQHIVGDFDGDGLDEICIRSANRIGLLKWQRDRFRPIGIQRDPLGPVDDPDDDFTLPLRRSDRSSKGRFLPDRDCILHRTPTGLFILSWDGTEFGVRQRLQSSFNGRWDLSSADKLVLGDFHKDGPDLTKLDEDYIGDGITDIFMHNSTRTGTVGVNYTEWDPNRNAGRIREEIGLTWVQDRTILNFITG